MLQLVGQICALCEKPIVSILDGDFCPSCTCPVHNGCRIARANQPGCCATCGADARIAAEHQQLFRTELARESMDLRSYHLLTGVASIVGGLLCLLIAVPAVFAFLPAFRWIMLSILISGGSGLIATGARQLRLLRKDEQLSCDQGGAPNDSAEISQKGSYSPSCAIKERGP